MQESRTRITQESLYSAKDSKAVCVQSAAIQLSEVKQLISP